MTSVRSKNSTTLVFIFGAVLILASASQSEANVWHKIRDFLFPRRTCRTTVCEEAAQNIIDNRDATVNPCVDFYDYTCGGWSAAHPLSENKTTQNAFKEAYNRTSTRLRKILEEETEDGLISIKKARKVYRACLHSDPKQNMQVLVDRLGVWGGWPIATESWDESKFDWKKLLVNLITTDEVYPLLSITIDIDPYNTSRYVTEIGKGKMLSCLEQMNEETRWPTQESVAKIAGKIAKAANQSVIKEDMIKEAQDMISMDLSLCMPQETDEYDFTRLYPKTLKELQNYTDSNFGSSQQSKIDWVAFMKDLLPDSGIVINEDYPIKMASPLEVLNSLSILYTKSPRTIANYMLWHKVAHYEEEVFDQLQTEGHENEDNSTSLSHKHPRWQVCVWYTNENMGHAIGYEYVKLYFQEDEKKRAKELVRHILDSFTKDLRHVNWMDLETRLLAIEKARNMVTEVGYPDWYEKSKVENLYKDYIVGDSHLANKENLAWARHIRNSRMLGTSVDPTLKFHGPATTNAFYSADINTIWIPAGILQAPFYINGRPEAMNYGAIGMVIGHEISHAFDDPGLVFGKLVSPDELQNHTTLLTYLEKEQCFRQQYNEYPLPPEYNVTSLNGFRTLKENIADNGGLQKAWKAYKQYVEENGSESRLPGLEEYTPEQLFFIGFASVWCQSSTPETVTNDIKYDVHSPKKYRTVIPLDNSNEFADAWKCQDSDSKVTRKCTFW